MRNWKISAWWVRMLRRRSGILKWGIERHCLSAAVEAQPVVYPKMRNWKKMNLTITVTNPNGILKWGIERNSTISYPQARTIPCILKWGIESKHTPRLIWIEGEYGILKWGIESGILSRHRRHESDQYPKMRNWKAQSRPGWALVSSPVS